MFNTTTSSCCAVAQGVYVAPMLSLKTAVELATKRHKRHKTRQVLSLFLRDSGLLVAVGSQQ